MILKAQTIYEQNDFILDLCAIIQLSTYALVMHYEDFKRNLQEH